MKFPLFILTVLICALITSCGQYGGLYLPDNQKTVQPASSSSAEELTATSVSTIIGKTRA